MTDRRISDLDVAAKAALCSGADLWHTVALPEHGIPAIAVADGPHGLRRTVDSSDAFESAPATCFPTAAALGSTWDPELVREVGAAIAQEALAQGVAVVLGPGVNIKRSPLCGRNFEYLSEDPLHAGRLAAALVDGLQGSGVGASLKHFAANNQETDRHRVSAEVDERTLREIYLPAFEHVVTTARPWTVMCAYNRVNGTYASEHHELLTEILRDEWGFDGVVVSDWGAVHDRVAALRAGLDLEMPPNRGVSDAAVVAAVADGTLDEAVLDQAVARVLTLVDRAAAAPPAPVIDEDAQHALARRVAADGIVLLRNDDVLPLTDRPGLRVGVVGPFATQPRYQGVGSSKVNPTKVDVPLDELVAALPQATVRHAAGCPADGEPDAELVAAAVAVAADSDVVVAYLGLPDTAEAEGYDRTHIDLPAAQPALLAAIAAAAPDVPVVAVLANGSAVRTGPWEQHVAAIVECWLGGQAGGGAVADVLTGAVDPSGRLAETIPLRLEDVPSTPMFPGEEGRVRYGEGVLVGYRGFDAADREVGYPFGHGLSYTTFAYSDLAVTPDGDGVRVAVTIANTGARAGREVVQVYVGSTSAVVVRPPRELRDFAKIALAPGESRRVEFRLGPRAFAHWSVSQHRWVVEPGTAVIAVGPSSRDLPLQTSVAVPGATPLRVPLGGSATLREWMADPAGVAALRRFLVDRVGSDAILDDGRISYGLGGFPISALAAFLGLGVPAAEFDKLALDI
ncbi:glycoside hydrolase family 3 C-terminal domain-containing protein [Pseudonocardia sp. CA-107938]|uniref:glycoside hydrolase family 3 C-terminal domain-containing protein n=1 Tax=Pseudonocardia sp. CA-107938 TaxID=3240021 RepID=UPI003D91A5C0